MEKLEHLALMFNKRTKNKKYENFIINTLYSRIANLNLIPITQQYVKSKNSKNYHLLDLYFPQINYGVEIDENQHNAETNNIQDNVRAEEILNAIQCKEGRITVFNKNGTIKNLEEVDAQIEEQIKIIKDKIKQIEKETCKKLVWKDNDERKKECIEKRCFDSEDDINFSGITEIYKIFGHDVKRLGSCFVKLNKNYKLWVPYLAIKLPDGTVKTRNGWENTLSDDDTTVTEIVNSDKRDTCHTKGAASGSWNEDGFKRVVFVHIQDAFGKQRLKFLGVYQASEIRYNEENKQERLYKRLSTRINFDEIK